MKKLTNEILMMFIMEDIESLKVAGLYNQKYTPHKANFHQCHDRIRKKYV